MDLAVSQEGPAGMTWPSLCDLALPLCPPGLEAAGPCTLLGQIHLCPMDVSPSGRGSEWLCLSLLRSGHSTV